MADRPVSGRGDPPPAPWFRTALWLTLAVTGFRVVLLAFNRTDLFVDEAQYWLWSQDLSLGYYSKPPMIAWVIAAFTAIGGDGQFWVRLPGPLFHGVTALLLGAITARLGWVRAAVWVVAAYLTLPAVALASLLISTDTIMFPFLAAAYLAYIACLGGAGLGVALLGGVALGLGFLSKYAAVYFVLGAVLAIPLRPRLSPGQALTFLAGFALAAAPNVLWNLMNGMPTVQHTLDNADWVRDPEARAGLNLSGMVEFIAAQAGVIGPVLFGALVWLGVTFTRRDSDVKRLLLFSLPIIVIVSVQALLSHAYANWAAAAYLTGLVATVPWLLPHRRWLTVSFALNGAICLALPLASVFADSLTVRGQPLLARYLGRADMSRQIIATAKEAGLEAVVSGNRDILADLFYTGRDSGLTFRSTRPDGRAANHYALRYPFEGGPEPVLFVERDGKDVCPEAEKLTLVDPPTGAWRGKPMALWKLPGTCL